MQKVGVGVHYMHMENELFNQTQKPEGQTSTEAKPKLSFIPSELLNKIEGNGDHGMHERCALFGLILGAVAVVSWIVILFGVVYSIVGIALSVIGLKSSRKKWAQIGLGLSVLGLVLSILYIYAAYNGMINYNYFTSEFWG